MKLTNIIANTLRNLGEKTEQAGEAIQKRADAAIRKADIKATTLAVELLKSKGVEVDTRNLEILNPEPSAEALKELERITFRGQQSVVIEGAHGKYVITPTTN